MRLSAHLVLPQSPPVGEERWQNNTSPLRNYTGRPASAPRVGMRRSVSSSRGDIRQGAAIKHLRQSMPTWQSSSRDKQAAPFRHTEVSLLRQVHNGGISGRNMTPTRKSSCAGSRMLVTAGDYMVTNPVRKSARQAPRDTDDSPRNLITISNYGEDMYDSD